MDPITLIVTAIVAGAAVAAKDVAAEAVRDAYAGFKALVIGKFGSTGAVEASLQQVRRMEGKANVGSFCQAPR